jgi:hypothetical protein
MSSPQIQLALWIAQPVMQALVLVAMFRRKLHKSFPVFFSFAIAQIVVFLVQFPVYRWASRDTYFYVFWISMAVNLVIEFKIIHEVFLDVFRPYHALKDLGTALFKWAALIMILVSVVLISITPGWDDPILKTVLVSHRCVRVIQCGLVLFLLAFSKPLGFSWKRQSFGIAMGFGVLASAELLAVALYSGRHISGDAMNIFNMTAYMVSVWTWLAYCWVNSHDVRVPVLVPQRWDEALMDINPQNDAESLIPMFEHMVDRAFSKTQSHV